METTAGVSLMIMYEDESVDVRYADGTQLQLSPCGCEFVLTKATDPRGHPLQPTERVRQRTRFTISSYKERIVAALAFRNKHAKRPYLPEELICSDQRKLFFSIDSGVQWPERSSCEAELGSAGETIIQSDGGRAMLKLSPSGEEFSVEFLCSFSHTQNQLNRDHDVNTGSRQICDTISDNNRQVHEDMGTRGSELTRARSCSPQNTNTAQLKPEQMFQSTTVVQHHSCCDVPPMWLYPLSLARHHWKTFYSSSKNVETEKTSSSNHMDDPQNMSGTPSEERTSHLPGPLPLTCPSPHWHRWKVKNPLAKEEPSDFPTELVKIMWRQGVTYRILSGAVSVIEISPGDGSVIRSNGILNSYFTHRKPEIQSKQVKEVIYHLGNLPPDVPGLIYSVSSIVSRASRILTCYSQAVQLLKFPVTPSCLQEDKHFSKPIMVEKKLPSASPLDQDMSLKLTADSRSQLVAAELEKIKRFNFLLENCHFLRTKKGPVDQDCDAAAVISQHVDENCVAEALQRTSKAIQDIDAVISAAKLL